MVRQSTLFLALTRPALKWGVPVEAFWTNVLGTYYFGAFFQSPTTFWRCPLMLWLIGIPVHVILRELTAFDYHWATTLRLQLESSFLWRLTSAPQPVGHAHREIPTSV